MMFGSGAVVSEHAAASSVKSAADAIAIMGLEILTFDSIANLRDAMHSLIDLFVRLGTVPSAIQLYLSIVLALENMAPWYHSGRPRNMPP